MYSIINKLTREVIRESATPFNVDATVQPEDANVIQLTQIYDDTRPVIDEATQKLHREFTDDDVAFTRTFRYVVVTKTAEEQAAYTQGEADETERRQLKTVYQALKDGTGTTAVRLQRVERVCARLLRDAVRN